jgi:hypothetical protein
MKIGLVQVDGGEYPNLALMQICGYHESLGHQVEWFKGMIFQNEYDLVYASKIFQFSEMPPLPENAIIGGTGINFTNVLSPQIANHPLSYSLYQDCTYHIGFSMKGCRLRCQFCCVPQKEGRPVFNSVIDNLLINPKGGNRLMLLDNDFFGIPEWRTNLIRIIELKLRVCFVQGLNIRIITQEQADLLSQCNYQNAKFHEKYLTFAWDKYNDRKLVLKGIETCNKAGIPNNKMQFFVLIGYNTTAEQDLERVMMLRELGCMPFAMPFKKSDPYQKAFARWVNNRAVFKSCTWEDYKYNNG